MFEKTNERKLQKQQTTTKKKYKKQTNATYFIIEGKKHMAFFQNELHRWRLMVSKIFAIFSFLKLVFKSKFNICLTIFSFVHVLLFMFFICFTVWGLTLGSFKICKQIWINKWIINRFARPRPVAIVVLSFSVRPSFVIVLCPSVPVVVLVGLCPSIRPSVSPVRPVRSVVTSTMTAKN